MWRWGTSSVLNRPRFLTGCPVHVRFERLRQPLAARRRRLDELTVDDTELEDEQESLYVHGCKMDSGLGQGLNQLQSFEPKLHDYD